MEEKYTDLDQTPKFMVVGIRDIGFKFMEWGIPDSLATYLQRIINKTLSATVKVDAETKTTIKEKINKILSKLIEKGLLYRDPLDKKKWVFTKRGG